MVGPGSAKGSKHLSRDLLWSTHDSVMHAVWFYSLWECILTSKCSRRSCPRRLLPLIFCVLPYSGNQKRKTHRIWPTLFWGPGPLRSSPIYGTSPCYNINSEHARNFWIAGRTALEFVDRGANAARSPVHVWVPKFASRAAQGGAEGEHSLHSIV